MKKDGVEGKASPPATALLDQSQNLDSVVVVVVVAIVHASQFLHKA